jgi:uroporphyrinogen-III decarboxylase
MSDSIEKKIDRILSYIEDDPKTGRIGMYQQVQNNTKSNKENKDEIQTVKDDIKTDKKVLAGKVTVLGFIGGCVLWLLKLVF